MLDNQQQMKPSPAPMMSRKRTRSRSEDSIVVPTKIQPLNMGYCLPAPFSEDPGPTQIREDCDYTIKITKEMAVSGEAPRPVRVYADGSFDLFHSGHARLLKQAKAVFPNVYLIVGVCSDAMQHKMKGRTVCEEEERYNAVRHCRYADEVLRDAPWEYSDEFLTQHKIDFVAHDDLPYPSQNTDDIYGELKKKGMFVATQRTEGISTSDLVARVVRDYDIFARRNLARGYSARDLNLSYLEEQKLKFINKVDEVKDKGKSLIDGFKERKDRFVAKWEDRSKEIVDSFLTMFEPRRIREMWVGSTGRILRAITPPSSPQREGPEAGPSRRIRRSV